MERINKGNVNSILLKIFLGKSLVDSTKIYLVQQNFLFAYIPIESRILESIAGNSKKKLVFLQQQQGFANSSTLTKIMLFKRNSFDKTNK